jgi:hypothetical protein
VPDDLLSIDNFALVSGLSIHALRHYDDVGVLKPAWVDPATVCYEAGPTGFDLHRLLRSMEWPAT